MEVDLSFICKRLGGDALQPTINQPAFPVNGMILHSVCQRAVVCLIVEKGENKIWVPFVVNNGSPYTYLRVDSFVALGFKSFIPDESTITIHGVASMSVLVSPTSGKLSVNSIGQEFFRFSSLIFLEDVAKGTVVIYKEKESWFDYISSFFTRDKDL